MTPVAGSSGKASAAPKMTIQDAANAVNRKSNAVISSSVNANSARSIESMQASYDAQHRMPGPRRRR
jgi:hypothetical protein